MTECLELQLNVMNLFCLFSDQAMMSSRGMLCAMHMLDSGMDLNVKDTDGCTPLHYAARAGNSLLCDYILKRGAVVNERNTAGTHTLFPQYSVTDHCS